MYSNYLSIHFFFSLSWKQYDLTMKPVSETCVSSSVPNVRTISATADTPILRPITNHVIDSDSSDEDYIPDLITRIENDSQATNIKEHMKIQTKETKYVPTKCDEVESESETNPGEKESDVKNKKGPLNTFSIDSIDNSEIKEIDATDKRDKLKKENAGHMEDEIALTNDTEENENFDENSFSKTNNQNCSKSSHGTNLNPNQQYSKLDCEAPQLSGMGESFVSLDFENDTEIKQGTGIDRLVGQLMQHSKSTQITHPSKIEMRYSYYCLLTYFNTNIKIISSVI